MGACADIMLTCADIMLTCADLLRIRACGQLENAFQEHSSYIRLVSSSAAAAAFAACLSACLAACLSVPLGISMCRGRTWVPHACLRVCGYFRVSDTCVEAVHACADSVYGCMRGQMYARAARCGMKV